MRFRLLPREARFYEMFSASAQHLVVGAGLLTEMVGSTPDTWPDISARMREAEHAADDATHAIYSTLNSTFVTPFDRQDIYALASALDDVMDAMEAAADLVVLYHVTELPTEVTEQVGVLQRAAELTAEAMPRLRSMRDLREYWIEINRLENHGDRTYRSLVARLFAGDYDALTVLRLKGVADQLEEAADNFERVANLVEAITVKES